MNGQGQSWKNQRKVDVKRNILAEANKTKAFIDLK